MSLSHAQFQDWLDRYVAAWKSYDPAAIGDLFAEGIEYRYHPQMDPVKGRDEVVKSWVDNKDDPGTYDASYQVEAIDGDSHVARGWSRYFESAGGALKDEYFNVYVCRFDADGRCTSFTEWWMQNRDFARAARLKAAEDAVEKYKAEQGAAAQPVAV
jgi:hypothetical protein